MLVIQISQARWLSLLSQNWRGQGSRVANFEASLAYIRSSRITWAKITEWGLTFKRWAHSGFRKPAHTYLERFVPTVRQHVPLQPTLTGWRSVIHLTAFPQANEHLFRRTTITHLNKDSHHSEFQIQWKSSTDIKSLPGHLYKIHLTLVSQSARVLPRSPCCIFSQFKKLTEPSGWRYIKDDKLCTLRQVYLCFYKEFANSQYQENMKMINKH